MPARGNLRRMAKPPTNLRDAVEKTVEATRRALAEERGDEAFARLALEELADAHEDRSVGRRDHYRTHNPA